jgi:hypothetical protein
MIWLRVLVHTYLTWRARYEKMIRTTAHCRYCGLYEARIFSDTPTEHCWSCNVCQRGWTECPKGCKEALCREQRGTQ